MIQFLKDFWAKRKAKQKERLDFGKTLSEKNKKEGELLQKLKEQQDELEEVREAKHKQERELLQEKSILSSQWVELEKEFLQKKQEFVEEVQAFQKHEKEATQNILDSANELLMRLEQEDKEKIEFLQKSLEQKDNALIKKEQEVVSLRGFLGKFIKIDTLLYIERVKDEKKCTLYYKDGSGEEVINFPLKDFVTSFPEDLAFCNRGILINRSKQFIFNDLGSGKGTLLIGEKEIEITRQNFKMIKTSMMNQNESRKREE